MEVFLGVSSLTMILKVIWGKNQRGIMAQKTLKTEVVRSFIRQILTEHISLSACHQPGTVRMLR